MAAKSQLLYVALRRMSYSKFWENLCRFENSIRIAYLCWQKRRLEITLAKRVLKATGQTHRTHK